MLSSVLKICIHKVCSFFKKKSTRLNITVMLYVLCSIVKTNQIDYSLPFQHFLNIEFTFNLVNLASHNVR